MKIRKKYLIPLVSLLLIMFIILVFNYKSVGKRPELHSISRNVANPGDKITLIGDYFGGEISRGRVYINENMVYKDFIESWSNNEITLTLTDDFKSGMITVNNMFGESNPYLITSFKDVPLIDHRDMNVVSPFIETAEYLDDSNLKIRLTGKSFGSNQNQSFLKIFSLNGDEIPLENSSVNIWSNDEIIFYLPYSMNNVIIHILNNNDESNEVALHNEEVPSVIYIQSDPVTYQLEQVVDIIDVIALPDSYIKLYFPSVCNILNQKSKIIDSGYSVFNDSSTTYDYIIPVNDTGFETRITLKSEVEVSSLETTIRTDLIGRVYDTNSPHFKNGFLSIPNVEESKTIKDTAVWLVRNTKNRYSQIEIIIDWILKYIKVSENSSNNATIGFTNRSVSNSGLVNLTVSMLRSIGIPSRVSKGIKKSEEWNNYQWMEFYIPDGGWIPVDLLKIKEDPTYKIGSIDNSVICFTRGATFIEYEDSNFIDDFYALQNSTSNFEGNIEHYSAIWHNVYVK